MTILHVCISGRVVPGPGNLCPDCGEAYRAVESGQHLQDRIRELEEERDRLRAELEWIAEAYPIDGIKSTHGPKLNYAGRVLALRARAALGDVTEK